MSVKIFLPEELFYIKENCNIYGEIKISDNNSVSYFVIAGLPSNSVTPGTDAFGGLANICSHLRHLGHIQNAAQHSAHSLQDVALSFAYDAAKPNIYLQKLCVKSASAKNANIFLYDPEKVLELHITTANKPSNDDMHFLYNLLEASELKFGDHVEGFNRKRVTRLQLFWYGLLFPLELMTRFFACLMETHFAKHTMRHMVFYEHYQEWKLFQISRKRTANIIVDRILGICGMLLLLFYIPHPEEYLMKAADLIISLARLLLRNLKGNPIGLKLNSHLNNFLLDCFKYHIDLWEIFLNLIEPFVHQLFLLTALFGSMGLTYQLALLADLITVIGLHAHCFYVYTAVLFKVEIEGLQVLWKVVRGKRYNVLKNRIESHNYNNRQLYLSTIFFTSLFFLFPTIIVYYGVFTSVRLLIFLENFVLQQLRRYILEFPLTDLYNWFNSGFFEIEGIQLEHVKFAPAPINQSLTDDLRMSVFMLKVRSSSLSRVFSIKSDVLYTIFFSFRETI